MSGTTLLSRTFDVSRRLAVLTMLMLGAPFTTAPKAPPHAVPAAS